MTIVIIQRSRKQTKLDSIKVKYNVLFGTPARSINLCFLFEINITYFPPKEKRDISLNSILNKSNSGGGKCAPLCTPSVVVRIRGMVVIRSSKVIVIFK